MNSRGQDPLRIRKLRETAPAGAVFNRTKSIAEVIERLVQAAKMSIDVALYRFNSQRLADALDEAHERGVRVRLVIDRNKYEESVDTRQLMLNGRLAFRLAYGRDGAGSKMHHKFVLLDDEIVLTGSYNWTFASEEKNYEHVLVLREPRLIEICRSEFEALWANAEDVHNAGSEPCIHDSIHRRERRRHSTQRG